MLRKSTLMLALVGTFAGFTLPAQAATITLQPDAAAGQDTFVYNFLNTSNFQTGFGGVYAGFLGVSNDPAHGTQSLIRFGSLPVIPANSIVSATLSLTARPNPFPENTTVTLDPVTVQAFAAGGAWAESTVTWNTKPSTLGSSYDDVVVNSVTGTFSWDITDLLVAWLDSSIVNNGVLLALPASPVEGAGAAFRSSDWTTASERPSLTINYNTEVPEPASLALLGVAAPLVLMRRRHA